MPPLCLASLARFVACVADEEDEYMGDSFMSVCSSLDEGESCDVTAVDRFHGLRVAHPLEATKINGGITIGRDPSSGLVIDHPDVSSPRKLCSPRLDQQLTQNSLQSGSQWCNWE